MAVAAASAACERMNSLVKELRAGGGLVSHVTEFVTARRAHNPMMVVRWAASVSSKA